jgi:hypothetical protein
MPAIVKEGFNSFRVFPIEKVDGNFLDFVGCFDLYLIKLAASQVERKWMGILHTVFPEELTQKASQTIEDLLGYLKLL